MKHADSMKEGFVLSEISLENELIFNASIAKKSCIVVEEYVYENVNFKEEFQNKKNQEAPVLRYIVYTNNF